MFLHLPILIAWVWNLSFGWGSVVGMRLAYQLGPKINSNYFSIVSFAFFRCFSVWRRDRGSSSGLKTPQETMDRQKVSSLFISVWMLHFVFVCLVSGAGRKHRTQSSPGLVSLITDKTVSTQSAPQEVEKTKTPNSDKSPQSKYKPKPIHRQSTNKIIPSSQEMKTQTIHRSLVSSGSTHTLPTAKVPTVGDWHLCQFQPHQPSPGSAQRPLPARTPPLDFIPL